MNDESQNLSPNTPSSDEEQRVMPLGVGDFSDETGADFSFAEEKKKGLSGGSLIMLAVVVVAGVGLYSMRTLSKAMAEAGKGDVGLDETVESFLDSLSGNVSDDRSQSVLGGSSLVEDRTEYQVPLENVQKNPFIDWIPKKSKEADEAPVENDDPEARLARMQSEARDELNAAAANLQVIMIMGGSTPMANISGRVVQVGQRVIEEKTGLSFTISEIDSSYVILEAERPEIGFTYQTVLRLSNDF